MRKERKHNTTRLLIILNESCQCFHFACPGRRVCSLHVIVLRCPSGKRTPLRAEFYSVPNTVNFTLREPYDRVKLSGDIAATKVSISRPFRLSRGELGSMLTSRKRDPWTSGFFRDHHLGRGVASGSPSARTLDRMTVRTTADLPHVFLSAARRVAEKRRSRRAPDAH
jgi:hypothetical protein